MTKENYNPPPPLAPQHKKPPELPELDEAFGTIEVFSFGEIEEEKKHRATTVKQLKAQAQYEGGSW